MYFTPVVKDKYFIPRCWGKNLAIGGSISLSSGKDWQNSIYITVRDSSRTFSETADTLYVPANQSMSLQLNAGGIAASAMLGDLIEIELVKVQR